MVGIDTNILVRFFMRDDERQSQQAAVLIDSLSETEQGFISFVAVAELAWVMRYVFQIPKPHMIAVLSKIPSMAVFALEDLAVFLHALRLCHESPAEFVDCLIVGVAARAGCSHTVTFDKKASRLPGMQRIV